MSLSTTKADTPCGTKIFELQTAALRYELGDGHVYDFVQGSTTRAPAPGVCSISVEEDEFVAYFDETSLASCRQALDDLDSYIVSEGPFDAVMAFSQGAILAATLMVRKVQQNPTRQHIDPLFKCAIFFCGGVPGDPSALLRDEFRLLDYATDGEVIHVPTAHIWGANDLEKPTFGPVLSKLCSAELRTIYVHGGGHEVPGAKDKGMLGSTVNCIRRTIDRALAVQYLP